MVIKIQMTFQTCIYKQCCKKVFNLNRLQWVNRGTNGKLGVHVVPNVVNLFVSEDEIVRRKELAREAKCKKSFVLPLGDAKVKPDWIIYQVTVHQCSNHGQPGHNVRNLVKSESKCVGENVSRLAAKVS